MGRKKKGDMSAKKIRVSYTIKPELNDEIIALADKHSQSVSSVFEEAVEYFLELVKKTELEKQAKVEEPKRSLLRRPNVESPVAHEVSSA